MNYQFSWKIKLWSHYWSYSPEIWRYLKDIEQENNFIEKYIKLKHQVESAIWDSEAGLWRFKIRNLQTDEVFDDAAEFCKYSCCSDRSYTMRCETLGSDSSGFLGDIPSNVPFRRGIELTSISSSMVEAF